MAVGRLSRRPLALAALLLAVLLLHLGVGEWLQSLRADWRPVEPMPPPLQVSFVQPLVPRAPPPARAPRLRRLGSGDAAAVSVDRADAMPPAPEAAASTPELDVLTAQAPVEAPADGEPGPEWPLSTRLSYQLTGYFRGPVSGHSSVEWLRQGSRYQVRLEVAVGPRVAPLISRQMMSDGRLTPRGIAPQRFDEDTRILIAPRQRRTLLFDADGVTLADGRREPALPGVQDASSQFVQLTWLFLTGRQQMRPGLVVELPLALPRRQYWWAYRVLGEEVLDTPLGPLSAWHLQPTRGPGGGDLVAEVWLAPSLQYLPVRLLIREDAQNFVDLRMDSAPLQEAPIVQPLPSQKDSP
ncbi:DUF3108 domain-containing protein [Paucibacter sp. R3-3]|uniref:DUF3108 domain-containing protein n=1 Tax=Roseateles agri TaxID=3098619 RepID=A0ABU5DDD7_9BURK|nr:DUF3108 domain-containing protein [Paucibacter sp. R3-3]MDY0744293.1 DUF3108 domain-containing protein [Paucibacter sp. R3-3]